MSHRYVKDFSAIPSREDRLARRAALDLSSTPVHVPPAPKELGPYDGWTYEEVVEEVEKVIDAVANENLMASRDDCAHDVYVSYLYMVPPNIGRQIAIGQLGWDPDHDRDLFRQHHLPRKEKR